MANQPIAPNLNNLLAAAQIAAQDQNGDDVYSNEKALFGYIEAHFRLVLPAGVVFPAPPNLHPDNLGKLTAAQNYLGADGDAHRNNNAYLPNANNAQLNFVKAAAANYVFLRQAPQTAEMTVERAFNISIFRARWLILGCFYAAIADRNVTYEETVTPNGAPYADIGAAADMNAILAINHPQMIEFRQTMVNSTAAVRGMVQYAETVWAIAEFLFRVRGHHYKSDYDTMIEKCWKSVSEQNVAWPASWNKVDLLRTAIHPFGVKALPVMVYHFLAHGRIGNGLLIRLAGAPNGFAAITTAAAGLASIASEQWYSKFYSLYKEQVDTIKALAGLMLDGKYNYHISARLYGATVKRTIRYEDRDWTMNEVEAAVTAIAPIVQGFISWTANAAAEHAARAGAGNIAATFSLANAKTLEKRAASNPVMVLKIQALLESSVNMIGQAKTVKDAIDETFVESRALPPAAVNQ